jgi:hypothetical protein
MGAGGNHLANLLSLSGKFKRQVDFSQYDNLSSPTAHFSDALNLSNLSDSLVELRNQSNVFCAHLAEYIWNQQVIRENFVGRKFLIIDIHDAHQWIRQRMIQFNPGLGMEYFWQETSTLYSQELFTKLTGEQDFFEININVLFDSSPQDLIDILEQMLAVKIDREPACKAHQKWKAANYMSIHSQGEQHEFV